MSSDLEQFLANARSSAAGRKITHLNHLNQDQVLTAKWSLDTLRGRLVELSAQGAAATLTAAIELVVEAQVQSEPVAWIASKTGTFYPPDVADSGVDLAALVVIRADGVAAARAAERLLRSGAFGLVVVDLSPSGDVSSQGRCQVDLNQPGAGNRPSPIDSTQLEGGSVQGRLINLAQAHDAAVVCITDKPRDAASLGSLISLRAEAMRIRDRDGLAVAVRALKDKRRGPGWEHVAMRCAPPGFK